MPGRPVWAWAALVLPGLLGGCGKPAEGGEWFPLRPGMQWTYRTLTTLSSGDRDEAQLTLSSLGEDSLPDGSRAWHRRSDGGMDYWLRSDATGIFRVAAKSDNEADATPDKAHRYVLKAPYGVGTQWQATTAPYLLKRPQEFPPELRSSHTDVPMTYTIDAIGEDVDTPAGHFKACLRVAGRAALRLYLDPVTGWADVPLNTTEWYCPGPGLVKLVRDEPGRNAFLTGGTYTMELIEWHPAS